jgi:hypothetical protein
MLTVGIAGMAGPAQATQTVPVGSAIEVPGTAALNTGGDAQAGPVSCSSAGNCTAGGFYTSGRQHLRAFVVDEVNGTWHTAVPVPGSATLVPDTVTSLSCGSAGNCTAGGWYVSAGHDQAFVAEEVNGTWHHAIEVPGTGALNTFNARVSSVSCPTAGTCAAGGTYTDGNNYQVQVFVANEVDGIWHPAVELPGIATLNVGRRALIGEVSCGSAGNCVAAGSYEDKLQSASTQAFVADEVNGTWHHAIEVPGTGALNVDGLGGVNQASCSSPGNCAVVGGYLDGAHHEQAFVADEVNGNWHAAIELPGTAKLNTGGSAWASEVSCRSVGNCTAGGALTGSSHYLGFVASEVNGTWQSAIALPEIASAGPGGFVDSLSCRSAGNCVAVGTYGDGTQHVEAFVKAQVNGTWQAAVEMPGTAALNTGGFANVGSVSCRATGNCVAVGTYGDSAGRQQAFVTEP